MKMTLKMDVQTFVSGMIRATGAVQDGSREGMQKAMLRFLHDARYVPPACPFETGWLSDHHRIFVEDMIGGPGVVGTLRTYDTPYAASLHEGISRWGTIYDFKTPGTGPKWIGAKALIYRHSYLKIVAKGIRDKLRGVFRFKRGRRK